MAKVRQYNFTTGIETSTVPNPGTPSAANDTITLGYLEDQSYWGAAVNDYTALRALTSTQRRDRQFRFVDSASEKWIFDSASTSTDDGATVLKPNDLLISDPGRWLIDPQAGTGGGGAGGSGIEQVLQKAENERFRIRTEDLDNSVYTSGIYEPLDGITGRLLSDYSSGVTELDIAWNPIFTNDSDKDFNTATGWAAYNAATNLTTSATAKIGTASISIDKNGTSTDAPIFYDRGAANLFLGGFRNALFWVNLPSITNLANVFIRMAPSGGNYRTYEKTTDAKGNALAIGWNLISVDFSTDTYVTTGTGWAYPEPIRYVNLGLTTTIAGQTYAAVLFDSLMFSYSDPKTLGLTGQEITIYNNSIQQSVVIDSANTRFAGPLTISAATTNALTGGTVSAAATGIQRIPMLSTEQSFGFDSNLSSGTISTSQQLRISKRLRDSVSGAAQLQVDVVQDQIGDVTTVGGSTIGINDPGNYSANYANGDTIDIFRPQYTDGRTTYKLLASRSLTAASTHLSGITTLTLTTTSIAVGDIVAKRHVTSSVSVVAEGVNESFASASFLTSPNNIQVIGGALPYPKASSIVAAWSLGGATALQSKVPGLPNLNPNGSINYFNTFLSGRYASGPFTTGNWLYVIPQLSQQFNGDSTQGSIFQFSCWVKRTSSSGGEGIFNMLSGSTGYQVILSGAQQFQMTVAGSGSITHPTVTANDTWYHLFYMLQDGVASGTNLWVNGVAATAGTFSVSPATSANFEIGSGQAGGVTPAPNLIIADLVIWRNGSALTTEEIASIYNSGVYKPFQENFIRYRYSNTGTTGQKISAKVQLDRTTTAVKAHVTKAGLLIG